MTPLSLPLCSSLFISAEQQSSLTSVLLQSALFFSLRIPPPVLSFSFPCPRSLPPCSHNTVFCFSRLFFFFAGLSSSLSNPSIQASLNNCQLQSSLSNPSINSSLRLSSNSPRRRPAPISPLTLSPGTEQRRALSKQMSPTMSPALSPITQVGPPWRPPPEEPRRDLLFTTPPPTPRRVTALVLFLRRKTGLWFDFCCFIL